MVEIEINVVVSKWVVLISAVAAAAAAVGVAVGCWVWCMELYVFANIVVCCVLLCQSNFGECHDFVKCLLHPPAHLTPPTYPRTNPDLPQGGLLAQGDLPQCAKVIALSKSTCQRVKVGTISARS